MSDDEVFWSGVTGQAAAVADGTLSSRELVAGVLARIQRYDGRPTAFTAVSAEQALVEADAGDALPAGTAARSTVCRWRSRRSSTSPDR